MPNDSNLFTAYLQIYLTNGQYYILLSKNVLFRNHNVAYTVLTNTMQHQPEQVWAISTAKIQALIDMAPIHLESQKLTGVGQYRPPK